MFLNMFHICWIIIVNVGVYYRICMDLELFPGEDIVDMHSLVFCIVYPP